MLSLLTYKYAPEGGLASSGAYSQHPRYRYMSSTSQLRYGNSYVYDLGRAGEKWQLAFGRTHLVRNYADQWQICFRGIIYLDMRTGLSRYSMLYCIQNGRLRNTIGSQSVDSLMTRLVCLVRIFTLQCCCELYVRTGVL